MGCGWLRHGTRIEFTLDGQGAGSDGPPTISTRAHNVSSKTRRKNMQCRKFTLLEAKLEHFHRFEQPECSPNFHVRPCMPAGDQSATASYFP
jgi:hypothetical protein